MERPVRPKGRFGRGRRVNSKDDGLSAGNKPGRSEAAVSRRGLDDLRRAGGLARHAVDAIRFADHVGLVTPVLLPLGAALFDDLVVPGPLLAGGEEPFEHVDRADIHADAVRDASVKVDGHVGPVDSEPRRIRGAVRVGSLFTFGEDLVVEMNSRLRILVRLVHEVRVDRFRCEVHFSRHRVASKELGPALIRAGHWLVYPSPFDLSGFISLSIERMTQSLLDSRLLERETYFGGAAVTGW